MLIDWNKFAFNNINKKVVLITCRGVGHEGIIRDYLSDSWIELETDYGVVRIAMYSIVDTGVLEDESTPKMTPKKFKELLDELDGNSLQTLKEKNARYSTNGDCLHNFRSGSDVAGGTPAQACWGYMTKHLVALRDMVMKNDFSNREDFLEKCQDTINYVRFLWCIGNDENSKLTCGEEKQVKESN